MKILIYILLGLVGILALLLLIALFMNKEHFVKREIIIHAPNQQVFDFLKLLKNQEKFNKWAKADPERQWEYSGTDGTVGFVISWNGNRQAGEGQKEITKIVEGKRIETEIRFVRPMKVTSSIIMETEAISETQTKVSLTNAGTMNYPMNLFIPFAEKKFPEAMDESLQKLKSILEKE